MFTKTAFTVTFTWLVLPYILAYAVNGEGRKTASHYLGSADGKSFFSEMAPLMTWDEAKAFCVSSGMQLASVNSTAQNNLLVGAYNNVTFAGEFWTAGRDALTLAQFVWDTTKVAPSSAYIKLNSGPSRLSCLSLHLHNAVNSGDFHGSACTRKLGVLCEIVHGK